MHASLDGRAAEPAWMSAPLGCTRASVNDRGQHPTPTAAAPAWPVAACRLVHRAGSCRVRCPARRWPPSLAEDLSFSRPEERCPARPPTAGCSLAARTPRWRGDFDSRHRPAPPRPVVETRGRILREPEDRPTRSHPARSPLDALQDAARRRDQELIRLGTDLIAYPIHGLGDFVRCVAGHVGPATRRCTPRSATPLALGQSFNLLEDLVRDGNSRLHTESITGDASALRTVQERTLPRRACMIERTFS